MRHVPLVSQHDEFWCDFFEEDQHCVEIADRIQSVGIESRFSRPDWNTLLTPLIIDGGTVLALNARLAELRRLMRSAAGHLYGDDVEGFLLDAGFPAAAAASLRLPHGGLMPSRWDVLETADEWKTVELNAGGALGVFAYDAVQCLYDDVVAARGRQGSESWSSHVDRIGRDVAALMRAHGTDRAAVVVDSATAAAYSPIAQVVAGVLSSHLGTAVRLCDEGTVTSLARGEGSPLVVYQCCNISDRAVQPGRYADYDAAARDGSIVQAIDPMADVLASKAVMAMVWRCVEEGLLPDEQARLIKATLPHTVLVSQAARVGAIAERHDWVLKTAFGHGGYEVRCGWEISQEAWQAALGAACGFGAPLAILQRRVRGIDRKGVGMTPAGTVVHMTAPKLLGLFQQGDAYSGACARQSPHNGGVVSVGAGAALGVVRSVNAPASQGDPALGRAA